MISTMMYGYARKLMEFGLRVLQSTPANGETHELPASPPARALAWLRSHELPTGGIRVHSEDETGYPEVSGYLVPTLLDHGERDLATRVARWLLCIQRADGSFTDPHTGTPYIFDTGQALRGLIAADGIVPGTSSAIRRAAAYLASQAVDEGSAGFSERYAGQIPEGVHLYVLPPLQRAAEMIDEPRYQEVVRRCLDYYRGRHDFLQLDSLTHFLAYELEALIDLGRNDLALPILNALAEEQGEDGAVRAYEGVDWVCTPGLAQLAICWYKTGNWEAGDKALEWLEAHQEPSGGFRGSYGPGADYMADVEIPWAVKFYLDANQLRVLTFMERIEDSLFDHVDVEDGRAQAILSLVQPGDKVLEVGCGKGRFLEAVQATYPTAQCTGVDISSLLLKHLPAGVQPVRGALERIPLPSDSYAVVFSVEAIEHSANLPAAIDELVRVTQPGGWVVVIDKQQEQWGRLACPPWERWPRVAEINKLLSRSCDEVTSIPVAYDDNPADGLMIAWKGRKRAPLSGGDWSTVLLSSLAEEELITRVRQNHVGPWAQEVLLATAPGERVIEVGSGTGEMSLLLAQAGRQVTIMDISADSLTFTQRCADALGVHVEAITGDATAPLPFADGEFDCVWSSGLLDRFPPDMRRAAIRECARISSDRVIIMVANAACLAYRAGMRGHQEAGTWPYGWELPIESLRADFEAAGLRVLSEQAVGIQAGLDFMSSDHPLYAPLSAWLEGLSDEERQSYNQGYLLVTVGTKA